MSSTNRNSLLIVLWRKLFPHLPTSMEDGFFLALLTTVSHLLQEIFPGIPKPQVSTAIESLRNAAKDLIRPSVFYDTRVFPGPIQSIGLGEDRSIIAVRIPQGPDSPYIHNDGRIYLRVGDSSDPRPVSDRSTFDLLSQRGERARSRLEKRLMRRPIISEGESEQPFIHFSIFSDPYETMAHWYGKGFSDFSKTMRGKMLPFDNIFPTSEGYVARQASNNPFIKRMFTWEFSRNCHSFITFPIQLTDVADRAWERYSVGRRFVSKVIEDSIEEMKVLDLNLVLNFAALILRRHRILVSQANVKGPFYIKAHIENAWRTTPFVDLPQYLAHVLQFGFPVVQENDIFVPGGPLIESFVVSPELDTLPPEPELVVHKGAVEITLEIFMALGIPGEVIAQSSNEVHELAPRGLEAQRVRGLQLPPRLSPPTTGH